MKSALFICIAILSGYALAIAKDENKMEIFEKEYPDDPVCIISTSMGDIYIELFADEAPKTVSNFIELAEGAKEFQDPKTNLSITRPFYDGLIFHRVIKDFMMQGGCPSGDGTGGPGYHFEDEINAALLGLDKIKVIDSKTGNVDPRLMVRSQEEFLQLVAAPLVRRMGITSDEELKKREEEINKRISELTIKECYENMGYKYSDKFKSHEPVKGSLAMANAGPNTNGSQFFINMKDTPWLAGKHTVFGKVIKGIEVVEKAGETKVNQACKPETDIKIKSIRLYKEKTIVKNGNAEIEFYDLFDTVKKSGEVKYILSLSNQSDKPLLNIKLECTLPDELTFVNSTGRTKPKDSKNTRQLIFEPLGNLKEGESAKWIIIAKAEKSGEAIFTAKISGLKSGDINLTEKTVIKKAE
ncbi:MAG: peptidylprolyl isomerase [Planctomycetes bacterium]|nr:peptidylprolyl isomerase [Planctomycetota bacterium]